MGVLTEPRKAPLMMQGRSIVILVTRLNGLPFAVNPDLLERVESTPDTVLTLIDGTKYIITESVHDVVALVRDFRASVVVAARDMVPDQVVLAHPHLSVAPEPTPYQEA